MAPARSRLAIGSLTTADAEHVFDRAARRSVVRSAYIAACVLLGIFTAGALLSRDATVKEWTTQMQLLTHLLAAHAGQTMSVAESTLATVTARIPDAGSDPRTSFAAWASTPARHDLLQVAQRANPFIDVVSVVDHRGNVLNFSRSYPPPPINLADRSYFQQLASQAGSGIVVSEPLPNRGNGKYVVYVAQRLEAQHGEFLGLVLVGLSVDVLEQFYAETGLVQNAGVSVALFRDDLTLLARWPPAPEALGRRISTGAVLQMMRQPRFTSGVMLDDSPRNLAPMYPRQRLIAVQRVTGQPLAVTAVVTTESFLAQWWSSMIWSALLTAAMLSLLLFFTRRQLSAITRTSRVRAERSQAQLALLEAANGLEQRVALRTSELRREIAQRQAREQELAAVNARIAELSHLAGMAEVANSVLHNVGNVLNSLNTSSTLLLERLQRTPLLDLPAAAGLLRAAHSPGVDEARSAKQAKAVEFVALLAGHWRAEHDLMLGEAEQVRDRLRHIHEIVTRQQSLTHPVGSNDVFVPAAALRMVLSMHLPALQHAQIEVIWGVCHEQCWRGHQNHLKQILLNLIVNAEQSFSGTDAVGRRLVLECAIDDNGLLQIQVADNGIGLSQAVMTKLFTYGFTTRPGGHGLGLHASALAARAMGGNLEAFSAGPGHGARFILRLPQATPNDQPDEIK